MAKVVVNIDGAARGNPGPAAWACVIVADGQPPVELAESMGTASNNVAEYTALVNALTQLTTLGYKRAVILSDSELLVKQMNGEYRVKSDDLRGLFERASELRRGLDAIDIQHVRREKNKRADELCNQVLDGGVKSKSGAAPAATTRTLDAGALAEVHECLRMAAVAWAKGNPADPPIAAVWEQLWSVVVESGVVRRG